MAGDICDWLTLFSVPGLGPAAFSDLLSRFRSPKVALRATLQSLCQTPGIGAETARAIRSATNRSWASDQVARAAEAGADIITLKGSAYPRLLRRIYAPPPLLFVKGDIKVCAAPFIAIVGSRSFTPYGRDCAFRLAGDLAEMGITTVSGMAMGIDGHAHSGALQSDGATAAVLGSGLDRPYPLENLKLFRQIADTGAVISEFPLGTTPEAHNFPRRNRIISGLSLGVVVVEAGDRSGALITARHALEQNREVFAYPGPVTSGKSLGTNRLIKEGTKLVQTVDDILQELPHSVPRRTAPGPLAAAARKTRDEAVKCLPDLDRRVLRSLSGEGPDHIDACAAGTRLPAAQVLTALLSLELAGLVEQLPGKRFLRKAGYELG